MYELRAADLAVDTSALTTKSGTFATAFEYTDEQATPTALHRGRGSSVSHHFDRPSNPPSKMASGYAVSPEPPALFVRAMYDYDADDHTSLSFRRGDIIQVLNQLETGWWDGVIDNIRGWFPSNYCSIIEEADDYGEHLIHAHQDTDLSADSGLEDEYGDGHEYDEELDSEGNPRHSPPVLPIEGIPGAKEHEEAAFWIPQATPDGRLFYFNTLTGYSTMELPFENPTVANENGPRDRTNFFVPDQTRPPPELMARGFERDEDDYDGSASEAEGESLMLASHDSISRRRQSFMDGVSPATSMDSLYPPGPKDLKQSQQPSKSPQLTFSSTGTTSGNTSIAESFSRPSISSNAPEHFVDDGFAPPITWPLLLDNMQYAVEAYRQTLLSGERSEYVRKAEDISDHLRMLLAAGSDTTDNHSGNPSIISTNKALYPYFRDMMSKFSKLVLSSHIAAADWPGSDSVNKCLQEADGVMQGVYGYVDVARQQRGENIRRIVPGFVAGSSSGGSWQNNGVSLDASGPRSFLVPEGGDSRVEPSISLEATLLDQIDILRRSLVGSIRRLEERLVLNTKIVTVSEHEAIADAISVAAIKVVEQFRPWVSAVESINLAPLGTCYQNPQMVDFSLQKQRVYDSIGDFVLSCQAVSAPLADEWAELRGDSLDDRLNAVRSIARQLENYVSQIGFSLSLLLEQIPVEPASVLRSDSRLEEEDESLNKGTHSRAESQAKTATESIGIPSSYAMENDNEKVRRNMDKAQRFFGQAPPTAITREPIREPVREPEETPWFLKMDHEAETFYDTKGDVPVFKCGTLSGLVENLTRHDKLDASFNNTFLLTYRSFTTASELFEMLVQRFNIQPPFGLNQDDMQMWIDRKQKPIRFRVVNILKSWFDHFWMENNDEVNMDLLRRVHAFTKDSIATTKTPGSPTLLAVIEQRLRGQDTTVKRLVPTQSNAAPPPIIPKNMKKLKFLDIDPTEFARQLTIIESRLYSKIRATECLNKTWQKKVGPDEPEPASNVKSLILHSNQLTNWVAEMILTQGDVKKRVVVIKHFVNVADKCRALNNYSTLTSIISALGTAPIHRLGRTWGQVSGRTSAILEQMRRLMASTKNFGEYRETLHLANPPCIPFFGVYLTDLTFIEDGIPSLTPSELINFSKRAKTAEVIRDIQQYQNVPYLLQPVPELQDYILSNLQAAGDVHDMYDRSLEIEPREREDEKIARYAEAASKEKTSLLSASSVALLR
ncbi:hypothetical protein NUU61_004326 [Penicillium alfredii]|uniref:Class E vacuolar protein-sorting machinery protein HSE1 n=1 Tax=Penicillium alfredii TaxID=1506179 RepID=A0A9W9KD88_9EURO|nr:uncharacterized protein NUU61_004326 [Penicillium alfredii]KAJ5102104.1 hypothetical protein NUU61_004326 [Penicillium alfredii]